MSIDCRIYSGGQIWQEGPEEPFKIVQQQDIICDLGKPLLLQNRKKKGDRVNKTEYDTRSRGMVSIKKKW